MPILDRLRGNRSTRQEERASTDAEVRQPGSTRIFTDGEAGQIGGVVYRKGLEAVDQGDLDGAARYFRQAAAQWPQVGWFAYRLGSVLLALGCVEEADRIFARGHAMRVTPELVTDTRILLVGPKHFAALSGALTEPTPSVILPGRPSNPPVILFLCCDSSYFKLYGGAAIASALDNSAIDLACHIHIVNPDGDAVAEQNRLRRRHGGRAVSFSSERTDLSRHSETDRKVYYACRRFQLLPAILRRAGGPIVIADVDQLLVRSLDPVLRAVRDADVGLIEFSRLGYASPLAMISASAVVAATTTGARRYFDLVAAYIRYCFERDLWVWHLDQAALFGAKLMVEAQQEPVRIRPLDPAILESTAFDGAARGEAAPGTVFWSITHSLPANAAKRRLDLFERYRNP